MCRYMFALLMVLAASPANAEEAPITFLNVTVCNNIASAKRAAEAAAAASLPNVHRMASKEKKKRAENAYQPPKPGCTTYTMYRASPVELAHIVRVESPQGHVTVAFVVIAQEAGDGPEYYVVVSKTLPGFTM